MPTPARGRMATLGAICLVPTTVAAVPVSDLVYSPGWGKNDLTIDVGGLASNLVAPTKAAGRRDAGGGGSCRTAQISTRTPSTGAPSGPTMRLAT